MKEKSLTKILLVDDDVDIQEFMSYNLRKESYQVFVASNGFEAIKIAEEIIPDLIILDVMMPGMDGIEACEKIRNEKNIANVLICFLTARGEDYSQIAGFDAGADDYITKPIKPNVFLKKIDALLRRAENHNSLKSNIENIFTFNNIEINYEERSVFVDNLPVTLAKKEFNLLKLFCSAPGKVFTRDEIYSAVWGNDVIVGDRTIDVHIRKLREKLGDKCISTLKGIGYKLEI
jgi:two-component system alkaline phosphatase synthesis response regulator PhoP